MGGKLVWTKVVPTNISEILDAEALAFWIMGDGSFRVDNRRPGEGEVVLYTGLFSLEDAKKLASVLESNFGLSAYGTMNHNSDDKKASCVVIRTSSVVRLRELVASFMDPSMVYRLGL